MTIPTGTTGDARSQDAAENAFTSEGKIEPKNRRHYVACCYNPPADVRTGEGVRPILHLPDRRLQWAQTDYVKRKFARPQ
jgi:hypothetical protein